MVLTCPHCGHSPVARGSVVCPRCRASLAAVASDRPSVERARLEFEDLRQQVTSAANLPLASRPSSGTARPAAPKSTGPENDTSQPFHPIVRPPLIVLCIVDAGKSGGEWVRVRGERAVIGRTEGDILIPHDTGMSGQHAELCRVVVQGRHRWALRDLKSTNGTFVRVAVAPLEDQQEILIGMHRFRFEAGASVGNTRGAALADTRSRQSRCNCSAAVLC